MSDTKKCSKCGVGKPATPEFFNRVKRGKSGTRSEREGCVKEYAKLYYENNKEKIKETAKLWRENNKEKINEKQKLY